MGSDRRVRGRPAEALGGLEIHGLDAMRLPEAILATAEFRSSVATTRFLDEFKPWTKEVSSDDTRRALFAAAIAETFAAEDALRGRLDDNPWGSLAGWRLLERAGSESYLTVDLQDSEGASHRVVVRGRKGAYHVEYEGEEAEIRRRDHDRLLLRSGDRAFTRGWRGLTANSMCGGWITTNLYLVDLSSHESSADANGKRLSTLCANFPGWSLKFGDRLGNPSSGRCRVVLDA